MVHGVLDDLAPNFPVDRHITFALGGALEIATYTFVYFVLSRYGRRVPMCAYQSFNGVICILIAAFLILIDATAPWTGTWRTSRVHFSTNDISPRGLSIFTRCGLHTIRTLLFLSVKFQTNEYCAFHVVRFGLENEFFDELEFLTENISRFSTFFLSLMHHSYFQYRRQLFNLEWRIQSTRTKLSFQADFSSLVSRRQMWQMYLMTRVTLWFQISRKR